MGKRVLLDACVPHWLRSRLKDFDVQTARFANFDHLSNGALIAAIEGRYDVLVTLDRNLTFQQRLEGRAIAVIVLRPAGQARTDYAGLLDGLVSAIGNSRPGSVVVVGSGRQPYGKS